MNKPDIDSTLAEIESLWPGKITDSHHKAMRPALERMPINYAQARAALGDLCCTFKGYIQPAHIVERLRGVAFENMPEHARSRRSDEQRARVESQNEHAAIVAQDNARAEAWVRALQPEDFEDLMLYIRHRAPFAFAMLGAKTLDQFRRESAGRGLLCAAWRESRGVA